MPTDPPTAPDRAWRIGDVATDGHYDYRRIWWKPAYPWLRSDGAMVSEARADADGPLRLIECWPPTAKAPAVVWCWCYPTPEPEGCWNLPDDWHADVCGFALAPAPTHAPCDHAEPAACRTRNGCPTGDTQTPDAPSPGLRDQIAAALAGFAGFGFATETDRLRTAVHWADAVLPVVTAAQAEAHAAGRLHAWEDARRHLNRLVHALRADTTSPHDAARTIELTLEEYAPDTDDTCQHPDMYACGRDGGKHGHCADCDQRINPATPNQQRARDVIAAWLAGEDLEPVQDGHRRAAEHLLGELADAGLAIRSEADEGPAP